MSVNVTGRGLFFTPKFTPLTIALHLNILCTGYVQTIMLMHMTTTTTTELSIGEKGGGSCWQKLYMCAIHALTRLHVGRVSNTHFFK